MHANLSEGGAGLRKRAEPVQIGLYGPVILRSRNYFGQQCCVLHSSPTEAIRISARNQVINTYDVFISNAPLLLSQFAVFAAHLEIDLLTNHLAARTANLHLIQALLSPC